MEEAREEGDLLWRPVVRLRALPKMKQTTSSIQRRLAAILYADVAGYSRLMNADDVEPCAFSTLIAR